jgi:hypothetical protein
VNADHHIAGRHETQVADQLGDAARRGPQDDLVGRADLEHLATVEDG